ncbi:MULTISPECIES: OadG family transporter subunit [unclassified Motilimonas]|uniref:OadG family protein n=1 Tax=Motilimonas TaxID=1914248 RepID=UPI001E62537D|nr:MULTISPECIES: OadG family transporter subunit [unclassified Motilimonas]MCE0558606.1 OadG family protein [Motilimonas sp. E26]MDO6527925.1 OadG family transporter subunit [Motilimonas sp. 1_MG-2023]
MDITELLLEAGNLMLVGMISVFLFLGLLVIVVQQMAKLCPVESAPVAAKKPTAQPQPATLNPKLIAAITSAVQQYRENK